MAKYTDDFKLAVVQDYLNAGGGYSRTAQRFQIHKSFVELWTRACQHNGTEGIRRRKKKTLYSTDFKYKAVMSVLSENLSIRDAGARLNIPGRQTLSGWLQQYSKYGIEGLKPKPKGRKPVKKSPIPHIHSSPPIDNHDEASSEKSKEALLQENLLLRAELDYLKKLDVLIREKERRQRKL